NTLTAIARSGGTPAAVSQCRRDIALLESALGESGGAAAADRPGAGPVAAVEAVVGEMRARGLAVGLEVTGGRAAPGGGREPGPGVGAMAHATREALANVAEHAGTGQAWVTVSVTPAKAAGPGRIRVTVRDAGAGFDPGRADPGRLGVRRSITERVEDWGGSASVRSAPGQGTTVCLRWPAVDAGLAAADLAVAAARRAPGQW